MGSRAQLPQQIGPHPAEGRVRSQAGVQGHEQGDAQLRVQINEMLHQVLEVAIAGHEFACTDALDDDGRMEHGNAQGRQG
jgi:hypothetical protein